MHRRPARVAANEPLTPNVRRLLVRVNLEDGPFEHIAGQAVVIEAKLPDGTHVRAPYSIASAPGERGPNVIELAVSRDEPGSRARLMHDLALDAEVEVVGPVGTFIRPAEAHASPALFVAAGTGLSPLRSMIAAALRDEPKGPPLVLLFGTRTEEEILWRDDLAAWPRASSRITTMVTLSRGGDGWQGRRGWVQAHLAEAAALAGPDAYAFVCGPEPMVQAVMGTLSADHLPEIRVHRERYG